MFLEIKPYQMVNLNDVVAFSIYPNNTNDYTAHSLFIELRGIKDSSQFHFETLAECERAYRRLINALRKNGSIIKELYEDALED